MKLSDCWAFSLLCSEHLDADCFKYTMRLQNELLGSCPWKQKLKPEAISTNFPRKPARSARTSSSRRTEKRQRQEVCKAGCGYTNAMAGNSSCIGTRTSSSRRTEKRQRQEVCKAGCGYTNAMAGNSSCIGNQRLQHVQFGLVCAERSWE